MKEKLKIADFWWYNNVNCWRIQRGCMVDLYFYIPTGRYIYKSNLGTWYGTRTYITNLLLPKEEQEKRIIFKNENKAVRWLAGIK